MHPIADLRWLQDIRFFNLKITAIATAPIHFSRDYGSALRGGLGYPFKELNCQIPAKQADCLPCPAADSCAYFQCYGAWNPLPWHKSPAAPRPFILRAGKLQQKNLRPGACFTFQFLLLEKYRAVLPQILHALAVFGRRGIGRTNERQRGTFALQSIHYAQGRNLLPIDPKRPQTLVATGLQESDFKIPARPFRLRFLTRTRLMLDKQLIGQRGDFAQVNSAIIQNLFRRYYLLYAAHGNPQAPPLDNFGLELLHVPPSRHRLVWNDCQRRSVNHKKQVPLGGFTGTVQWPQAYNHLYPVLKLGQMFHVSKSATMGLGAYRIEFERVKV